MEGNVFNNDVDFEVSFWEILGFQVQKKEQILTAAFENIK